jgi:hypothetical protein
LKAALHSQLLYQDRVRDRMRHAQGRSVRSDVPHHFSRRNMPLSGKFHWRTFVLVLL